MDDVDAVLQLARTARSAVGKRIRPDLTTTWRSEDSASTETALEGKLDVSGDAKKAKFVRSEDNLSHQSIARLSRMLVAAAMSQNSDEVVKASRELGLRGSVISVQALDMVPDEKLETLVLLVEGLHKAKVIHSRRVAEYCVTRFSTIDAKFWRTIISQSQSPEAWRDLVNSSSGTRGALAWCLRETSLSFKEYVQGLTIFQYSFQAESKEQAERFFGGICKPLAWFTGSSAESAPAQGFMEALLVQMRLLKSLAETLGNASIVRMFVDVYLDAKSAQECDWLSLYLCVNATPGLEGRAQALLIANDLLEECFGKSKSSKLRTSKLILASQLAQAATVGNLPPCQTTPDNIEQDAEHKAILNNPDENQIYRTWFREKVMKRFHTNSLPPSENIDRDIFRAWKTLVSGQSIEAIREHVMVVHKKRTRLSNNVLQSRALVAHLREEINFLGVTQAFRKIASDSTVSAQSRVSHYLVHLFIGDYIINQSPTPLLEFAKNFARLAKFWLVPTILGRVMYPMWYGNLQLAKDAHTQLVLALANYSLNDGEGGLLVDRVALQVWASSRIQAMELTPSFSPPAFREETIEVMKPTEIFLDGLQAIDSSRAENDLKKIFATALSMSIDSNNPDLLNGVLVLVPGWGSHIRQVFCTHALEFWPSLVAALCARVEESMSNALNKSEEDVDRTTVHLASCVIGAWPSSDSGRREKLVRSLLKLLASKCDLGEVTLSHILHVLNIFCQNDPFARNKSAHVSLIQPFLGMFIWLKYRNAFINGEQLVLENQVQELLSLCQGPKFPPCSQFILWEAMAARSSYAKCCDLLILGAWVTHTFETWYPKLSTVDVFSEVLAQVPSYSSSKVRVAPCILYYLAAHLEILDLSRCLSVLASVLPGKNDIASEALSTPRRFPRSAESQFLVGAPLLIPLLNSLKSSKDILVSESTVGRAQSLISSPAAGQLLNTDCRSGPNSTKRVPVCSNINLNSGRGIAQSNDPTTVAPCLTAPDSSCTVNPITPVSPSPTPQSCSELLSSRAVPGSQNSNRNTLAGSNDPPNLNLKSNNHDGKLAPNGESPDKEGGDLNKNSNEVIMSTQGQGKEQSGEQSLLQNQSFGYLREQSKSSSRPRAADIETVRAAAQRLEGEGEASVAAVARRVLQTLVDLV